MELKAISERVQVFLGHVNVGLVLLGDDRVALIDSGIDRRMARQILETLQDYRYQLTTILNTHAHADHIGGNAFLHEATGCRILAGRYEAPAIADPLVQAIVLFGGAPFEELLNHFLVAEPSPVEHLPEESLRLEDLEVSIIDLPGHSIGQKGFLVDGVAFLADTLFSAQALTKYRLLYTYDPLTHQETLEQLKRLSAKAYVGGHFPPQTSIASLLAANQKNIEEIFGYLKELLTVPHPLDRLIKEFLTHFGLKRGNWEHFLYRATVNGYLSALKRRGEADFKVMDNLLVWFGTAGKPPAG